MRRLAAALALVLPAAPALAQDAVWTLYSEDASACYVSSPAGTSVNTRDGEEVEVSRGVTRLVVGWRPADGMVGQVSFTGGYPFDPERPVTLATNGQTFEMTNDGEWAYSPSPEADAEILAALRAGESATLTGLSTRGTQTQDTFPLEGFDEAVDAALERCPG
ncbi:hypothetical protein SAMN05444417_2558 [Wenxinia saemankumensis]|uniref:Invasion protein IalB, involved in pathogenesis n=2 Tax=Wenxinia saemankumensis TaxID=1447782 RepID=A0A1M6FXI6_9RHOB|nr:hypothetical protein SAMN05444417_2558 [Wenxinia saemankumensis]